MAAACPRLLPYKPTHSCRACMCLLNRRTNLLLPCLLVPAHPPQMGNHEEEAQDMADAVAFAEQQLGKRVVCLLGHRWMGR